MNINTKKINISHFITTQVKNFEYMFYKCISIKELDIFCILSIKISYI